mgnify:CR=1 FL=1
MCDAFRSPRSEKLAKTSKNIEQLNWSIEHGSLKLENGSLKVEHVSLRLEHGSKKLVHGSLRLKHGSHVDFALEIVTVHLLHTRGAHLQADIDYAPNLQWMLRGSHACELKPGPPPTFSKNLLMFPCLN